MQMGDESWQNYHNTVNDLVEKRDAYNMGMLGSDDSTGTSATSKGGGGFGIDVNLDANDTMIYTGQPGFEDGENIYVNINDLRPAVEDPVVVPKPDPTKEIYVYISEDDFNATMESLLAEQEEQLTELGMSNQSPDIQIVKEQIDRLISNRELSKKVDEFSNKSYETPVDAAKEFGLNNATLTAGDGIERVAVIITMEIPVMDSNGSITYEKRSILENTLTGQQNHVIPQLLEEYERCLPYIYTGAKLSFVHTHPSGYNTFSGVPSETFGDLINAAIPGIQASINDALSAGNFNWKPFNFNIYKEMFDSIKNGVISGNFSNFEQGIDFGDRQATWLPGVDTIYMISTDLNEIYGCTKEGPITDPSKPGDYLTLGSF